MYVTYSGLSASHGVYLRWWAVQRGLTGIWSSHTCDCRTNRLLSPQLWLTGSLCSWAQRSRYPGLRRVTRWPGEGISSPGTRSSSSSSSELGTILQQHHSCCYTTHFFLESRSAAPIHSALRRFPPHQETSNLSAVVSSSQMSPLGRFSVSFHLT